MWVFELVFEHLDGGSVKEDLIFEYTKADYEDVDKIVEISDFEMNHLTGMKFETAISSEEGVSMYLSDKDEIGVYCYCVKYSAECVKVYEIKPTEGELKE